VLSDHDGSNYHLNPNAPIYITAGGAGNQEGHSPISYRQEWTILESQSFGFGNLTVFNQTHAYWEYYAAETGDVVDYVMIEKNRTRWD
jgi:hypothetical protein